MPARIDFQTEPARYRHWKLAFAGDVAELIMDVDENAGLFEGYQLKLNSYDLGVDIELADAVQRLRFEHPEVKVVVLRSGKDRVFCAGANIRMLAGSSHTHKVNFCKFTTNAQLMEDAARAPARSIVRDPRHGCRRLRAGSRHRPHRAGGRRQPTVALPELPLLAVLPGTGGLTRVTDKRSAPRSGGRLLHHRGGRKGAREVAPGRPGGAQLQVRGGSGARKLAAESDRPGAPRGHRPDPIRRSIRRGTAYSSVRGNARDAACHAHHLGPGRRRLRSQPVARARRSGLRLARELDDAILHLRPNEPESAC
jgi:benzoyl-CoA-dihydrodiol lyase